MRNKKLFTLISIILILSLTLIGCGKKSQAEVEEIEDDKVIVKEENNKENNEDNDEEINEKIGDNDKDDKEELEENVDSDKEKQQDSTPDKPISNKSDKPEDEKPTPLNEVKDNNPSVSISIIGPEDVGTILETTEVDLEEGDTVLDILKQVTKENNIQMEYGGKKSSVYIKGIDNIYEFDKGPESGWILRVNGETISSSSGSYKLNDGDKIEWLYTIDLGREYENKGGGE